MDDEDICCVEYRVYFFGSNSLVGWPGEEYDLRLETLALAKEAALELVAKWTEAYCFVADSFKLEVDPGGRCLKGKVEFGDCVVDEWFVVFLLLEITKRFPGDCAATVWDNDGNFLLIEGADFLPEWISPENSEDRVFLFQGHLHIVNLDQVEEGDDVLGKALSVLASGDGNTRVSSNLEDAAFGRYIFNCFPEPGILESGHKCICKVPRTCAPILSSIKESIALAAHRFYQRSEADAQIYSSMNRFSLSEGYTNISVRLPRFAFAHLARQPFTIPCKYLEDERLSSDFLEGVASTAALVGIKLACGLELLINDPILPPPHHQTEAMKVQKEVAGEILTRFPSLRVPKSSPDVTSSPTVHRRSREEILLEIACHKPSIGYGKESNHENQDFHQDDESWLDTPPSVLEKLVSSLREEETVNKMEAEVKDLIDRFKAFVQSESAYDGIGPRNENESGKSDEDEDGIKEVDLDHDKLLELLGHRDTTSAGSKEISTAVQAAMDEQVMQETHLSSTFSSSADSRDATVRPVDIDLNLVEGLLNAFALENGGPGPASTLLKEIGLR